MICKNKYTSFKWDKQQIFNLLNEPTGKNKNKNINTSGKNNVENLLLRDDAALNSLQILDLR